MQLKDSLIQIIQNLPQLLPELWIGGGFLFVLLLELFLKYKAIEGYACSAILWWTSFLIICAGFAFVIFQENAPLGFLFHDLLNLNHIAILIKEVILIGALWLLLHIKVTSTILPPDFYSIFLTLLLGLLLLTMAVNGLSIYLSLELVSICSYLIVSLEGSKKASEGGMKYLLFGALSSGIMLYGMSLIYGITGTLNFTDTRSFEIAFMANHISVLGIAFFLLGAGIFFKLSLVPFHIWTPDVYEGAPMPIAALLSTIPKLAALLVLIIIALGLRGHLQPFLVLIATISITLGNLAALWQTNLKRLLAYSGIAQAGFIIVGVVAQSRSGFDAALFYAITYIFINLGVFLALDLLSNGTYTLQSLTGKGTNNVLISVCLTVLMIALVGLPPTVGFTAKLLVFSSLWENYQTTSQMGILILLLIGLLNTVISLFYYFKIPYYLFFKTSNDILIKKKPVLGNTMVVLATLFAIVLFVKADWLLKFIQTP